MKNVKNNYFQLRVKIIKITGQLIASELIDRFRCLLPSFFIYLRRGKA